MRLSGGRGRNDSTYKLYIKPEFLDKPLGIYMRQRLKGLPGYKKKIAKGMGEDRGVGRVVESKSREG